ncbi:MAG TPA: peptidoglycan-associated lipoprotein Pal [Candidatus Polarisedimenticolia bacterium]|nr:peptidoglycan-associated lipoprotein Pal [Candidatus Polarisedimenticolia bacterium]
MSHGLHRSLVLLIVGACLVLGMAACKSSPTTEPVVSSPPAFESPSSKAEKVDESTGFKNAEPGSESLGDSGSSAEKASYQLKRINFDFDRYEVRQDAIRILGDDAATIKQYPQYRVRIEGHCDERGTVEYNLALGEKRARAARDYLVSLGTPAARLRIISYGKERPVDPGHNEDAWATNRRAEFVFLAE